LWLIKKKYILHDDFAFLKPPDIFFPLQCFNKFVEKKDEKLFLI